MLACRPAKMLCLLLLLPCCRFFGRLEGVPAGQLELLGGLRELEVLSLADCDLAELPAALGSLQCLRVLFLHGNPLAEVAQAPAMLGRLARLSLDVGLLCRWLGTLPAPMRLEQLYLMRSGGEEEFSCDGMCDALRALPALRYVGYVRPAGEGVVRESFSFLQQMLSLALGAAPGFTVKAIEEDDIEWN